MQVGRVGGHAHMQTENTFTHLNTCTRNTYDDVDDVDGVDDDDDDNT